MQALCGCAGQDAGDVDDGDGVLTFFAVLGLVNVQRAILQPKILSLPNPT